MKLPNRLCELAAMLLGGASLKVNRKNKITKKDTVRFSFQASQHSLWAGKGFGIIFGHRKLGAQLCLVSGVKRAVY
jgi:hypothetical protein